MGNFPSIPVLKEINISLPIGDWDACEPELDDNSDWWRRNRAGVKCINGAWQVPITTQWDINPYIYRQIKNPNININIPPNGSVLKKTG
jgi:hypothetical protein